MIKDYFIHGMVSHLRGICFFIEREELRERFDDENIEYIL